ncbi:MAG TPA: alpha-1,4-glucan--maltose-1-phosphate maltosyltransferase, partial [Gemmatimonadaceae bacterium]|nr:alpha-1,4-glucan--maltose-1-phosphate maltosyltransferase [Gemmatimonadaceae bacterium]
VSTAPYQKIPAVPDLDTDRRPAPRRSSVAARRASERRINARTPDRITIECVSPELEAGRYAVKRVVGDVVEVGADVFRDGHDVLVARILYKGPDEEAWRIAPMTYDFDGDRWYGTFTVDRIGRWTYTVESWTDLFATWRRDLRKKVDADQDVRVELLEGAELVRTAARRAKFGAARATLQQTANVLADEADLSIAVRTHRALDDDLPALMAEFWPPRDATRYRRELTIQVDRERARFASWYEFFPRSAVPVEQPTADSQRPTAASETPAPSPQSPTPRHGTFKDAEALLPRIAELGFDVVYLPPIHPIGRQFRKGRNNTLNALPEDVGSPWAIGNEQGGHDAIEPALGTLEDFDRFVARARELGLEVALDYALQCSPDHPWVKAHPDWFVQRPDGSIKYAENPPKKYQDIYPINFWCEDRDSLWAACRDVLLHWCEHGVRTFRVDNPHTKPWAFWEWVIDEVQTRFPDAIFFAEAFTRPKKMNSLAKLGFTMSYTHFTWKNLWWELRPFMEEMTQGELGEYFRGNLFTNTPDILTEYLVHGGRPAFRVRLLLAATLSPLYGIYSGYELIENAPVRPGSEEYLDSEKYQLRPRDWNAPGNLNEEIRTLNALRRRAVALQRNRNLTFHESDNPTILFYRKAGGLASSIARDVRRSAPDALAQPAPLAGGIEAAWGDDEADYLIAVNLDPSTVQVTMVNVPLEEMGLREDEPFVVRDMLTGARYTWRGRRNYVMLDPSVAPGHVLRVER